MDFDFNLILVPVTLILGLIWLADKLIFKQRQQKAKAMKILPSLGRMIFSCIGGGVGGAFVHH